MILNVQSTSEYARFVLETNVLDLPPTPIRPLDPPPLKSDDLFREPRDIGPPLSKILDMPLSPVCSEFSTAK